MLFRPTITGRQMPLGMEANRFGWRALSGRSDDVRHRLVAEITCDFALHEQKRVQCNNLRQLCRLEVEPVSARPRSQAVEQDRSVTRSW